MFPALVTDSQLLPSIVSILSDTRRTFSYVEHTANWIPGVVSS